ncbi:thiamine pyrophosphate-dependent enzyme [Chloroflexota bacterium]
MMDCLEAGKVISRYRGDAIVTATMQANSEWSKVSTNPELDLMFTGAMGKASSVGLGLALARPDKKVIVLDGDGSLLMNLGSLVTIASLAPPNLIHFVFENNVYHTSGAQPIPCAGKVNFSGLAKSAGYANVHELATPESLDSNMETIMSQPGPTFVCLKLSAKLGEPIPAISIISILPRFRAALQRSSA